jgi:aryl-alcohol dehydrogenase-like predicted oxidoreductase
MEYTQLPGSDLNVSRMALGTWLFGGRRWGEVDYSDSVRTIDTALEEGISFFDTADAYGAGLSETMLGEMVKGSRAHVVIATKVGVVWQDDGTRRIDLSPSHIRRAVTASLSRLQTDYIDLYQLHEPDPATPIEETGLALRELIDDGLVRYVGVSNFDVEMISRLGTMVPVLTTQSEYSLIKRAIEHDIVPYCRAQGVSLLSHSPLCRGLLSGKFAATSVSFSDTDNRYFEEEFQGKRLQENLKKISQLAEIAADLGRATAAVAIRWVIQNPSVGSVIFGARTPTQLRENLGGIGWELPSGSYAALTGLFSQRG